MVKKNVAEAAPEGGAAIEFDKAQILAAARYRGKRDLVDALVDGDKGHSFERIDGLIEKYMKGRVE